MSDIILKAENISKQYRLGLVGTGTISHDLNRWWYKLRGKEDPYLKIGEVNDRSTKGISDYVWALQNINFEVKRGEVLGIIGKNGAGKSTLLKILSKVTSPTTGEIKTKGRIASLLEVGTGFHGEMTGRENIFLNGAILGMTKKEIASKIDEIIEFSGCERYIDTPVKRYSSGMTVRLAFAVAAFLEPEILVIDEVLAVGDAEFQKKAIGKMQDISRGEGRTVLFVSHNMEAVKNLCTRGLLIDNGEIILDDSIETVVEKYLMSNVSSEVLVNSNIYKGLGCELVYAKVDFDADILTNGVDLHVKSNIIIERNNKFAISMLVKRESIFAFASTSIYKKESICGPGKFELDVVIPKYLLNPGNHSISICLTSETGNDSKYLLSANNVLSFEVADDNFRRGGKYVQPWGGVVSPILDMSWRKMLN